MATALAAASRRAARAGSGTARGQLAGAPRGARGYVHARRRRCGRPLRQQRNNPSQELLSAAAALKERFAVPGLVDAKLLRDVPGCLAPGGLAPSGLPPDPDPTPLLVLCGPSRRGSSCRR